MKMRKKSVLDEQRRQHRGDNNLGCCMRARFQTDLIAATLTRVGPYWRL